MRIERLHLRAYGHFTDHVMAFGAAPGVHLVQGANEAGKSTTLRALSSVLFGYPHGIVDDFRHDAKDMALGAEMLAQDGRRLAWIRRRRGRNALADMTGAPLEEGAVAAVLGGASRDMFEKVFALDHRRLREHARSLLHEGGSLGFSLAEAASGIAGLKAVVEKLAKERSDYFRASGSVPRINAAIRRLTELRKEARSRTVSPTAYKKLDADMKANDEDLREARERRAALAADIQRLERIARNLPRRAEHAALSQRIEALSSVPLLPVEAAQERVKAQSAAAAARKAMAEAEDGIRAVDARIADIMADPDVLVHRETIERLVEQRPGMETLLGDVPRREVELRQQAELARGHLLNAELPGDPDRLADILPSALKRNAIADLATQGRKLADQRSEATDAVRKIDVDLAAARLRLEHAPKPRDLRSLEAALAAADRLGDITGTMARQQRGHDTKARRLGQSITSLGIAGGDVAALRALAVPPKPTVRRYAGSLSTADQAIAAADAEAGRLDAEIAALERKIAEIGSGRAIPAERDVDTARAARDRGWSVVRGVYVEGRTDLGPEAAALAPDGQVAAVYESLVRAADDIADSLRLHAEASTALALHERDRTERIARRGEAASRLESARRDRDALMTSWNALWPQDVVRPQLPQEMVEWLSRRADLLTKAEELEADSDALADLVGKQREATDLLARTLDDYGDPPSAAGGLDILRDQARLLRGRLGAANTECEKAAAAVRALETQVGQSRLRQAELDEHLAAWSPRWRAALEAAGLAPSLTPESAAAVLDILRVLDAVKANADGLRHRIAAMRGQLDDFRAQVGALAHLAPGVRPDDAIAVCRHLGARLRQSLDNEMKHQRLAEQREQGVAAMQRAANGLSEADDRLAALCRQAGCSDTGALEAIETAAAEKRQAMRELETLEKQLRGDGAGHTLAALFAECDAVAGDAIPALLVAQSADRDQVENAVEDLLRKQAELQVQFDQLLKQDQAATIMQDAVNVEAEIGGDVEAYIELTLQETLLRRAIDLYRDRNQGPILARARVLFERLTDGAYGGLRADVDDRNQPILLAEHRLRGSLALDALSDGTIDALYLALRLAVVQEHNATREPLPFVADDLLLNLDNARATAAFRALADVAQAGQVLFFTHHAHMLDLARAAIPGDLLFEHQLPLPVPA